MQEEVRGNTYFKQTVDKSVRTPYVFSCAAAGEAEPARGVGAEPGGDALSAALPAQPGAAQLLHHRLVRRVAPGRVARRGASLLRRRRVYRRERRRHRGEQKLAEAQFLTNGAFLFRGWS